jgi:hypothetical protein
MISEIVLVLVVAAARFWWELLASPWVWAVLTLLATVIYVEYG